jgi:hypothetical protein
MEIGMGEMRFELKPVDEGSEIRFELKPVDERPKRGFKRRSKYDPIIDRFLTENHDLVRVEVKDKDAGYMRINLNRLIISRGMKDRVKASMVSGGVYLEKIGHPDVVS